jgi:signal transduction histidine kinase/CheY-like chemotaxis protein
MSPEPGAAGPPAAALAAALVLLVLLLAWAGVPRRRPRLALALGLAGAAAALVLAAAAARAWGGAAALALLAALAAGGGLLGLQRRALGRLDERRAALQRRIDEQAAALVAAQSATDAARGAAEAADAAKGRFLAAASHDLRQPLHALGLYLATLRDGALAPAQAEVAERMAAAHAALEAMFAALMDVSRLDAGALAPRWGLVPLAPLLRRLADEWAAEAEARGLRLVLRVADDDAATVTDALLLERIVRNLLANAFKYTRTGGVLLACRTRRAADGTAQHRIEVWDSGVGIAAVDQERVFDEFFQAGAGGGAAPRAAAHPARTGLGLGLAIVRRLARLLGLEVVLRSRPGRGSVFFVAGLAAAGAAPRAAAAARAAMSSRLVGRAVAVLDDDADVRDATARLLRAWGAVPRVAADAAALLALDAAPPAALVADWRLEGGRDGLTEARRLFAAWGRAVPLLLVSGEPARVPAAAAAAAGAPVLAKPLPPSRLRAWLERALADAAPRPQSATDEGADRRRPSAGA